jgi:hypothetical protein
MEYLTIENLKFHPDVEHEFIIEDDFENNCFPDQRFKSYADTWSFLYEKFPVIYKDDGTQDDRDNDLECFHAINITKYYGLASVRSDQFDPERDKILDNLVFGDEEDAQEYSWDPIIEEYSNHHVVDISRFIQGETMYVDLNLDALYLEEKEVQNA